MSVNYSNVSGFERYRRQVAKEAKLRRLEAERLAAEKAVLEGATLEASTANEPPGPFDDVPAPIGEVEPKPAPRVPAPRAKAGGKK